MVAVKTGQHRQINGKLSLCLEFWCLIPVLKESFSSHVGNDVMNKNIGFGVSPLDSGAS